MKKLLLLDNNTIFLPELAAVLPEGIDIISFKIGMVIDWQNYAGVIASGGNGLGKVADRTPECLDAENLIQSCTIPFLGICLGFQLLCSAYGAKLQLQNDLKRGMFNIDLLVEHDQILAKINHTPLVYESHRYYVQNNAELRDFKVLAESQDGVEIVKHKAKAMWGTQFHPEKSGLVGETIIKNFVEYCYS